ncbi:Uncharacterized protein PBTT_10058 [Plasmodiophora brassicae]|uniref:Uncharacterized protein n=1 Tax=Plasmodiophora brassicae TaxID=37360 RepID=A0A0G4INR6_PLABS|nr:hypothetical protein PBRA_005567 [Plasmodiophora brassicae]SPR01915.1 unnamed protein product [Plasmodiophora brassicae]
MDPFVRIVGVVVFLSIAVAAARMVWKVLRRRKQLISIEKEYATLREQRDEIQFHIDWALSASERVQAARLLDERRKIDKRLHGIQRKYTSVRDAERSSPKKQF